NDAGVAQLVERNLAKVEVASSRLVSRSRIFVYEHHVHRIEKSRNLCVSAFFRPVPSAVLPPTHTKSATAPASGKDIGHGSCYLSRSDERWPRNPVHIHRFVVSHRSIVSKNRQGQDDE